MTSNYFKHSPTPVNSSTSPVENLASEVSQAFEGIEGTIKIDTPIPSYASVIGNYLLLDVNCHGIEDDFVETISVPTTSSQVITNNIIKDVLSVSYLDPITNKEKYLDQKLASQSFNNTRQYKVLGKYISLSGTIPNNTIKVRYRGIRQSFGNLNLKPNVLFNKDKNYIVKLKQDNKTQYYVEYDFNINTQTEKLFNFKKPSKENVFLLLKTDTSYKSVAYSDIYISDNKVYFNLEQELQDDYEAVVFLSNITIGQFLEAFYKEFIKHDHSKGSLEPTISHNSLLDLYKNTESIFYKDTDIVNYQHPQFLNREGYNPEVSGAYENALLGDLLLSSQISDTDQEYKTLLKNSNSILFGDPLRGSRLYYDSVKKSIVLLSGNGLDGLTLVVGVDKKAIAINSDSFISEAIDSLVLKGKNNTVTIGSDNGTSTLKSDNLKINYTATIKVVDAEQLNIGNTTTQVSSDGNIVTNKKDQTLNTVNINTVPTTYTKLDADTFSSKNLLLRQGDKISTNDNNYIAKGVVGFDIVADAFKIRSTQKGSGLHIGSNDNLTSRAYTANYLGDKATQQDSSLYIEAPQNSDIYFIKNTDDTYTDNNITYAFNSINNASNSIKSLKQWKGANVFVNNLNASHAELKPITDSNKNGLKIGKTRLTVIGEGLECPEGMTILESLNTIHFINPLPENVVKCGDLSYQDVNLGKLQVFGSGLVEKSFSITEGLQVGSTITTEGIVVSDTTTTQDLSVLGDSKFLGSIISNGTLNVNNKLTVTGETSLNGSLKAFDLTVSNFIRVTGTLTVDSQAMFNSNVSVIGNLSTQGGFSTNGTVNSDSLNTGDITSSSIKATGSVSVDGTTALTGPTTIKGSLTINGNTNIDGTIETNSELTAKSLYVTTNTSIDGRMIVNDTVTLNKTLTVSGRVTTDIGLYTSGTVDTDVLKSNSTTTQTLQVTSGANIDGGLTTTGNTNTEGNLIVSGSCDISSTLTVAESMLVKGITVRDSVDINNRLTVSGSTFLEGTTIQIGTKNSTTTITGNVQLSADRLTLTGSMMIYQDLNVTGNTSITGTTSFSGDVRGTNSIFSSSTITGTLTAEVAEFNRRTRFNDGAKVTGELEADSLKASSSNIGSTIVTDLYAKNAFNMGAGSIAKMDSITVNSITQVDSTQDSSIAGDFLVAKDIKGKGALVLGDESIKYTTAARGVYLSPGRLTLGDGSEVAADKFTAKAGIPNSDANGTIGFTFDSLVNTGVYGAIMNPSVAKTSINMYIEGELKAFVTKENIGTAYPSNYDKHLVTLDLLKTAMSELREQLALNPFAIVDKCYPINSLYLTMDKRDPNAILGFGVWVRAAAGRTLLGQTAPSEVGGDILGGLIPPAGINTSDIGAIGGNYTHTLIRDELPNVQVELEGSSYHSWIGNRNGISKNNIPNKDGTDGSRFLTRPLGKGAPITTVSPYIVVGIWRRIG